MKLCQSLIASVILCLSCEEYSVAQAFQLTQRASVNEITLRKGKHHKIEFKDHSRDEPIESAEVQEISDIDLNSRLSELDSIINSVPIEEEDSGMSNLKVNDGNFMDRVLENAAEQHKLDDDKHDALKEKEMIQLEKQERKRVEHEEQVRLEEKQKKKELKQQKIKAQKAKKKAQQEKIINSAKQEIVKEKLKLQGKSSFVQSQEDMHEEHEVENHEIKTHHEREREQEEESEQSKSAQEELVDEVEKKQREKFERDHEEQEERKRLEKEKRQIDEQQHQYLAEHKKKKHHKKRKHHKKQEEKSINSIGDFGVETTKFDSNDKLADSDEFRNFFSTDKEKKPVEADLEPKDAQKVSEVSQVAESPVVASVEAPVETPAETPAEKPAEEAPVAKNEKSSLGNLMEQMMESHDDLESYITESQNPQSQKQRSRSTDDSVTFEQFDKKNQASEVKSQKKTKKHKKSKKVKKEIIEDDSSALASLKDEINLKDETKKTVHHGKKKKSHKKKHQKKSHKKQSLVEDPVVSESGETFPESPKSSDKPVKAPLEEINDFKDDLESKIEKNKAEIKEMAERLMKEHQEAEQMKQAQIENVEQKVESQTKEKSHKSKSFKKIYEEQSQKNQPIQKKEAPVSKSVVSEKSKKGEKAKELKADIKSENVSFVKAKPEVAKSEHKHKK